MKNTDTSHNQFKVDQKVKNIERNFTGTIIKETFMANWVVKPDKKELQELYPFGIECHYTELRAIE